MAKKKKETSNALEVQNAAKTLFANIRFASVDNPIQSIVMTSAVPNEGKTTTSYELCRAMAESGKKTLLIEADMRRRSLASMMGVRAVKGSYAVMSGASSLAGAVVATKVNNLYFLDCEPNIPNPADLMASKAFARLVDEACREYDYVVLDTPPVGTFVDAAIASRLVDGVVMVVKVGGAKREEILNAYEQLQKADAHVLGVCATFCEGTGSEYYYAYYNKDNQRVEGRKGRHGSKEVPPLPDQPPVSRPAPRPAARPQAQQQSYAGAYPQGHTGYGAAGAQKANPVQGAGAAHAGHVPGVNPVQVGKRK